MGFNTKALQHNKKEDRQLILSCPKFPPPENTPLHKPFGDILPGCRNLLPHFCQALIKPFTSSSPDSIIEAEQCWTPARYSWHFSAWQRCRLCCPLPAWLQHQHKWK